MTIRFKKNSIRLNIKIPFILFSIKSFKFDITCNCPYIDSTVGNIVPGLKTDFIVSIKNPSSLSFRNLKIDYNSNIPEIRDFSSTYGRIEEGSTINLLKTRILSPSEDDEYYFNISIAYESPFRQFFIKKESIKIAQGKIEKEKPIEIVVEEQIDVEAQESEENITQESEEKEAVEDVKEEEPIVLFGEKGEIPIRAISVIAIILVLIIAFVFQ